MKKSSIDLYLDELFPNPKCELNYSNDYELLIAIVLSAQSTDKRVNTVTPIIFSKYNSLKTLNINSFVVNRVQTPTGSYSNMFYGCNKLEGIIFSNDFDTSKVTTMSNMFYN